MRHGGTPGAEAEVTKTKAGAAIACGCSARALPALRPPRFQGAIGGRMQYQQGASPAGVGVAAHLSAAEPGGVTGVQATSYGDYKVIRRNGAVVAFEPSKIAVAMTKAFIAVRGGQGAASAAIREQVEKLTASVVTALMRRQPAGGTFHIEDVQDQVELSLMRDGAHDVARSYVLYRERRAQERAAARPAQPRDRCRIADDGRGGPSGAARHAADRGAGSRRLRGPVGVRDAGLDSVRDASRTSMTASRSRRCSSRRSWRRRR